MRCIGRIISGKNPQEILRRFLEDGQEGLDITQLAQVSIADSPGKDHFLGVRIVRVQHIVHHRKQMFVIELFSFLCLVKAQESIFCYLLLANIYEARLSNLLRYPRIFFSVSLDIHNIPCLRSIASEKMRSNMSIASPQSSRLLSICTTGSPEM